MPDYVLRLYVTGHTPRSTAAIEQMHAICDEVLSKRYALEVVDVLERPQLAVDERIIATPTVIKRLPDPLRRVIGDLSDSEKVLAGLELVPRGG
jgi:circadian clock protein KaiB